MKPTLSLMQKWFDEFNALVFDNKLPKVPIKFNNTYRQLGQFFWGRGRGVGIKISLYYDRTEKQFRTCLLHEMCHLYCYTKGWYHEGHGYRWHEIADRASAITGLTIQRVETDKFVVAEHNKAKAEAVAAKKNAPALLVDLDYGSYHFIVKTTKKVIWDNSDGNSIRGWYKDKVSGIYITDNPRALRWQNSRSLHRGYKFKNAEYEREIAPMLKKAIKVENLREVCFWGEYDCLGIR